MHACGHDLHMTAWMGTARWMAEHRPQWHGTLMLVGQPAEESTSGADAMLEDGLFTRFPKPDYVIGLHDDDSMPAGTIGFHAGPFRAISVSPTLTLYGRGGHGAMPFNTIDPVVMAARTVMSLQTIVSRENNPMDPVVLTIGSIHGGTQANVIPDEVTLGLTLRAYSPQLRDQIVADICRTANGLAEAYGVPADRMPIVKLGEGTSATINDAALAERLRTVAVAALGADRVLTADPVMGSEDVGLLSLENKIPAVMFRLGAADPEKLAESRKSGVALPGLHSALFAPVYSPTISTGVTAMSAMALDLLK